MMKEDTVDSGQREDRTKQEEVPPDGQIVMKRGRGRPPKSCMVTEVAVEKNIEEPPIVKMEVEWVQEEQHDLERRGRGRSSENTKLPLALRILNEKIVQKNIEKLPRLRRRREWKRKENIECRNSSPSMSSISDSPSPPSMPSSSADSPIPPPWTQKDWANENYNTTAFRGMTIHEKMDSMYRLANKRLARLSDCFPEHEPSNLERQLTVVLESLNELLSVEEDAEYAKVEYLLCYLPPALVNIELAAASRTSQWAIKKAEVSYEDFLLYEVLHLHLSISPRCLAERHGLRRFVTAFADWLFNQAAA